MTIMSPMALKPMDTAMMNPNMVLDQVGSSDISQSVTAKVIVRKNAKRLGAAQLLRARSSS
jgi:hypothetical protein